MSNGLLDALKAIGWPDLPKPIGAGYDKTWIKAIVKVRKYSGVESYCLAVNDGQGKPRIVRDFGPTAIIAEILSIHPYEETASQRIIPRFTNDEQIVKYLHKFGHKDAVIAALLSTENKTSEQIEADRAQVNDLIEQAALQHAKALSDIEEESKELLAIADPKLKEKKQKERKYGRTATPRKAKSSQS